MGFILRKEVNEIMKNMVKVLQLQQTIKTLQNENETLKNIIKEELYQEYAVHGASP